MKKLILITTLLLCILGTSNAQVSDSIYFDRLAIVCKAWGYLKYHHSEIASGSINWDDALLNSLDKFKNAPDNAAFNDSLYSFLNSAGPMSPNSNTLPDIPDSLNNDNDHSWMYDSILADSVSTLLDSIRSQFRPQSNVYLGQGFTNGNVTFDTDTLYSSETDYPDEKKRILAIFRYWNMIHYFYPYKKIMDQDWDITLEEFIPEIIPASDSLEYHLAFKRFTTRINDSHAFFSSPVFSDWLGKAHAPFTTRIIEDQVVISKVLNGTTEVSVGDVILKMDGRNIQDLRDSLMPYIHGSNDPTILRNLNYFMAYGPSGDFDLTIENDSVTKTVTLNRKDSNSVIGQYYKDYVWKDTLIGNCDFGIVDMGMLLTSDLFTMFNDLRDKDAIVFDIRNYPNGTLWSLAQFLYKEDTPIANFTYADINYPGRLDWIYSTLEGGFAPYEGQVIILFDENTQSHGEYTCMAFEQVPNLIKIGSTTAGADGNVSYIYLPGNIRTVATFLGTYYPDYTPTQRVGIVPDYVVTPTIQGIRNGEDEVMDFALNCNWVDKTGIEEENKQAKLNIFPNPTQKTFSIQLEDQGNTIQTVKVFSLTGAEVCSFESKKTNKAMDISNLENGVYIVKVYSGRQVYHGKIYKND